MPNTVKQGQRLLAPYQACIEDAIIECAFGEGEEVNQAVRFLLHSLYVGPNARKISDVTGIPRRRAYSWGRIARKNGIWRGHKVCCQWLDDGKGVGATALFCDAMVLLQALVREYEK